LRENVSVEVQVAVIGGAASLIVGGFGIVIALINRSARRNGRDHDDVSRSLGRIEGKLDAHLDDHRAGQ
jgi:hypothetical protein